MTSKPYANRVNLTATAQAAGLVVAFVDGKTRIESTDRFVSFSADTDIVDESGRTLTSAEAFDHLDLKVA